MIELFFVACLAGAPSECRDQSLLFAPETGLMTCVMGAQGQLARWSAQNPDRRIARWQCRMAGRAERSA